MRVTKASASLEEKGQKGMEDGTGRNRVKQPYPPLPGREEVVLGRLRKGV